MDRFQGNLVPLVSCALFPARFIIVVAPRWHYIDLRVRLIVVSTRSLSWLRWTLPGGGYLLGHPGQEKM